jgi:hypothetical protein
MPKAIVEAFGEDTFTLAFNAHDADCKRALALLRECDEIAAR